MRKDTFKSNGRGVFVCHTCGRSCRQTDTTGDSYCCSFCYELAGWENAFSDEGELTASQIAECRGYVADAVKAGGDRAKMEKSFELPPEVFA